MKGAALRGKWVFLIGPVVILGAWELLSRTEVLRPTFFPPPTEIIARSTIVFQGGDDGIADDLGMTVFRVLVSILLAIALGVGLGIIVTASRWTERGTSLVMAFIYPIPGVLFFPFLAFLLGRNEFAVLVTAVVTPFVVMVIYTISGVRSIDPVYLEVARNYGSRGVRYFRTVILPGALPSIITGIRISLGFGLISVIAIEMVGASNGLGNFLWSNWQILRVTDMYVALLCIAILGLLSSVGFDSVADRLLPWRADVQRTS